MLWTVGCLLPPAHTKLPPSGLLILFPGEDQFLTFSDDYFGGSVDEIFLEQVTAGGATPAVADAEVQVHPVPADRAGEADDLEIALGHDAVGPVGEAQVGLGQAAYAGHDPAGFDVLLYGVSLNFFSQVLPGLQAESVNL